MTRPCHHSCIPVLFPPHLFSPLVHSSPVVPAVLSLPALPVPQHPLAYSSSTSSPRVSSISSAASSHSGSQSSFTSVASSNGPKTPGALSPSFPSTTQISGHPGHPSAGAYDHYPAMNQGPAPDMYYQTHMSTGPAPPPQTVASHYPPQNPPLLQPGPGQYPPPSAYGQQYGYANGLTSPPGPPNVSTPMTAQNVLPLPGVGSQGIPPNSYSGGFDTTGQVAPPGMKPRVTATLWEDEGSLCFQVEARGICVARREDNHMINGTKLLNVAGMTRGRRDGILKSEKVRHVVKIGPMHLKGVWIPFERALDFANKEKITELLYPLFVHNIGALLYHPTNQTRTSQVMAAAERRKQEQSQMRNGQQPGLPSLQQHHHHSIPAGLPGPSQPPQPPLGGRPSMDRAHTFPTPPTSASSVMGGMGTSENFQWGQQGMNGAQGANPMSIDTGLNSARSLPTTPATTPPGSTIQSMPPYPPVSQPYDSTRPMYNAPPPQHSPYAPAPTNSQDRSVYSQPAYVKNEMGPPSSRPNGAGSEQSDQKPPNGLVHPGQGGDGHHGHEDETEHEAEYTHDSGAYDASRNTYNYTAPAPVNSMPNEHTQLSPEMTGSPHHGGSGRATPRTAAAPQSYYGQPGYNTPPRAQPPSSNLYNVMSNDRGSTNGTAGSDMYSSQGELQNGYPAPPSIMNGAPASLKRGRDDDDQKPPSAGPGMGYDPKRRKTLMDGQIPSMPSPVYSSQPVAELAGQPRR
ncbi:apses-domain-containing protein [Thozetella sp. PMI_491]|nr:apses-domain-containing protein [Thozetella sp. PMI_491]